MVLNRLPFLGRQIRDKIYLLLFCRRGFFFSFEEEYINSQALGSHPAPGCGLGNKEGKTPAGERPGRESTEEERDPIRALSVCQLEGFPLHLLCINLPCTEKTYIDHN